MNKILKNVFAAILAGICVVLAVMYFIIPARTTNGAEDLSAFPAVDLSSYFSGDFQDRFEQAMKDQFALHDQAVLVTETIKAAEKDTYNSVENAARGMNTSAGLVPFGRVYRMDASDWLSNMIYTYNQNDAEGYVKKAYQINALAEAHPEAKFYVYYCSRAEDVSWYDDTEGVSSYSYSDLLKRLLSPDIRFSKTTFDNLTDYSHKMYKTDHHWNDYGAWVGYTDILSMMSQDFDNLGAPRQILGENTFGGLIWQGSRFRECGVSIPSAARDPFKVYVYDLPEHKTYYGDTEQNIGLATDYAAGNIITDDTFDQYLNYYGFENKPITLDYGAQSGHNLLIVGDSFTRAVREQLASHFDKTVFVNFRILDSVDINALMRDNDIDAVLLIGQQDAWSGYFFQ